MGDRLERVRVALHGKSPERIRRLDEALVALAPILPSDLDALFALFATPDLDGDEAYMIVQCVESVEDAAYVAGPLSAFPGLVRVAPEWADLLLLGVARATECRAELMARMGGASDELRRAVLDSLRRKRDELSKAGAPADVLDELLRKLSAPG